MKYLILILLISLVACHEQTKPANQKTEDRVASSQFHIPDSNYVILNYKGDYHWFFKDSKPTTLTKSELAEVEIIIEKAIKENNDQQRETLEIHNRQYPDNQWKETGYELEKKRFKRQYVPVINSDGQKEIWINFFCSDLGSENWKSDIMIVLDGGNCYFNLKVNLKTRSYSGLSVNGYA
ncbi:MAG: hypothetical protein AAF740_02480 [Bacteroidota bacterium]